MKSATITHEKEIATLQHKLQLKENELNSLLQVTQAINSNLSATGLLKLYESILHKQLGISKLAVFIFRDGWFCTNHRGIEKEKAETLAANYLLSFKHIVDLQKQNHPLSKHFDLVVPVHHKQMPLAFTFLGGIEKLRANFLEEKLSYIQVLSSAISVAIENKRLYKSTLGQQILKSELEMAGQMQAMLIPGQLPDNERIQISGIYLPQQMVGGDYYDYFEVNDDECIFCIGDISGKGMPAALLMANFQASVRSFGSQGGSLKNLIQHLNFSVNEITKGEKFITLFLASFNFKTREYRYVNAGHNPAILFHDGKIKLMEEGCTILGMFEKLPYINEQSIKLPKPSITFCYTDGLTDIVNEKHEHLEVDHLSEFIEENNLLSANDLNKIMIDYLADFKGTRHINDDVSILTCKIF